MPLPSPPPEWGSDDLTKFVDYAHANAYATFVHLKPDYARLAAIDAAFSTAINCLPDSEQPFVVLFVIQAHSAFRAALRLSLSGQVAEAYACLRLVLEHSLYGFHISKNPASLETWLRRHENGDLRKKVIAEFRPYSLLQSVKRGDQTEGNVAETLYQRAIEHGAHPNERGLVQRLKIKKGEGKFEFQISYLTGECPALRLALRSAAQVGVCSLSLFRLACPQRFELIGLADTILRLRRGL